MVLNTIRFFYSNNWVKVNNQIFIVYNIIVTCFRLVNQENDLGHCLHSKCQITAIFTFVKHKHGWLLRGSKCLKYRINDI